MAEDEDQRQGDRVPSRAVPEVEVPRPEAGEEMNVSEPAVRVSESSSSSRERISKRVKFAEDVEELEANAGEQHLDVDIEMRLSQTSNSDYVAGDAAGSASEQMQTEENP